MRIVLRLVAFVGVVLALVVGIAYLLPREVEVERRVTVAAAPSRVFPEVNSLRRFSLWSPWSEYDPAMVPRFAGPEEGVGAEMHWESREVGSGTQVITLSVPAEKVEMALDFGTQGKAEAWFRLVPAGAGTEVTWGFRTDLGWNPVSRWMGLMFPDLIAADYDRGLARLKARVEAP